MSDWELTRLRVMIDLADGRLTVEAATALMRLGRRQIYRLRRAFSADGPAGLASRKRGRPSNRKRGETFRATVLSFVREHYIDFGPTLAAYNTRFGRAPANAKDLHRKLAEADDLREVLAWREERTVTKNLTLHYDRMMLMLDPTPLAHGLVRKTVDVVNYPDGRFAVQFEGISLPFRKFDKIQTVELGEIVENKRLGAAWRW